ncbi:unnamed protein product [Prorocentrum cordatum]|uniref:Uncharacterized protein n=1 Tax=Prorocentrum cordatum TaxID=2364126 RepID=A0ABN9PVZ7_9DINO|nr:unnamed protein product [Polarella glacialis]
MVAELATAKSRWAPLPARRLAIAPAAAAAGRALIHGDALTQQLAKVYVTKQLNEVYVAKQLDRVYVTAGVLNEVCVTTGALNEIYVTTGQKNEVYVTTEQKNKVYVTAELKDEVYVTTDEQNDKVYVTTDKEYDVYVTTDKEYEVYVTTDKQDEVYVTMTEPGAEWQGFGLKPPTFDGHDETWTEWSFVMRAYLGGVAATKRMLFALVMAVKGSAQMLIRSVEDQNGALAWRARIKRCEFATTMRAQSITTAILNVKNFLSDLAGFEQCHSDWERDIRRYETASGEVLNAGVKKRIYLQKAPNHIRTILQMQYD